MYDKIRDLIAQYKSRSHQCPYGPQCPYGSQCPYNQLCPNELWKYITLHPEIEIADIIDSLHTYTWDCSVLHTRHDATYKHILSGIMKVPTDTSWDWDALYGTYGISVWDIVHKLPRVRWDWPSLVRRACRVDREGGGSSTGSCWDLVLQCNLDNYDEMTRQTFTSNAPLSVIERAICVDHPLISYQLLSFRIVNSIVDPHQKAGFIKIIAAYTHNNNKRLMLLVIRSPTNHGIGKSYPNSLK